MYSVRGRSAATVATADHVVAQIWNPHATQRIKAILFSLYKQGGAGTAGDSVRLRRSTARGTPATTVTPDIDNHSERALAPPSGFLLDLAAFSVQPTLDTSDLGIGWTAPAVQGAGIVRPMPGIIVPPGTGLAIVQVAATIWPASEVVWEILEDWL